MKEQVGKLYEQFYNRQNKLKYMWEINLYNAPMAPMATL